MQYDFGELTVPLPEFKRHDTIVSVPVYMDHRDVVINNRYGDDYIMGVLHYGKAYPEHGVTAADRIVDWQLSENFFLFMARGHMNAHIVKGRGIWKCTLSLVNWREFRIHPELLLEQWDE